MEVVAIFANILYNCTIKYKGEGRCGYERKIYMQTDVIRDILAFSREMEKCTKKEAARLGILASFLPIMQYISANDGASQLEISQGIGFCPPTVSVTLKKMQSKGLVSRSARKGSGRTVKVFLTVQGREKLEQYNRAAQAVMQKCMKDISGQDSGAVLRVLGLMRENLGSGCAEN